MKKELLEQLNKLDKDSLVMLKLTIPNIDNFYEELINHPNIVRVVALSGGYTREDANEKLRRNKKLIASFSRALTEGLSVDQNDDDFNLLLNQSIESIYEASVL